MGTPTPFGRYLLLERIAVGGMAEVFAAKTLGADDFEKIIAIKRILPNRAEDEDFITMFRDEAKVVSLLVHANIAQVIDFDRQGETYYLAMEYVSGRDVRQIVERFRKRSQPVPIPMAAFLLAKVAEALDYAHSKTDRQGRPLGIVHRDISPQNVIVSYDGEVKLIDFGVAKAEGRLQQSQAGVLKGKFAYMSPEQVRGLEMDGRSDLYSAGVMLYEMITGTRLFVGESDIATLEKVRASEVRSPSEFNAFIPKPLERVVLKALAKEREDRYQTGAELHDELMRFLFADQNVYSAKHLAAFMKEAFAAEFKSEQERFERWRGSGAGQKEPEQEEPQFEPTRLGRVGHTGSGVQKDDSTRLGAPRGPFEPPAAPRPTSPPPVEAAPPPPGPPAQATQPPRPPSAPTKAKKKRLDDDGPVVGFFDDD